jgi:hypothetical protein
MEQRTYPAVRVRQTPDAGELVLFAAPALEIDDWSGVPQRERLGADETVGFQREENSKRLNELISFFGDPHNVIQNPLLCASRDASKVSFTPADGDPTDDAEIGTVTIEWEDLRSFPLLELLRRVKSNLEARLPDLAAHEVSPSKLAVLKERANAEHPELGPNDLEGADNETFDEPEDGPLGESDESDPAVTSVLFSDESHIADFWEELATRVKVLEESGDDFSGESFLGFPKDAMISYLQPVVVVDGQHRLRGAILAAEKAVNSEECRPEIEQAVEDGSDPDDITERIKRRVARRLPVSLLLESAPAEHVFQFIVVNQKATPIGRALLGTIVSTSLSNQELAGVSERLTAAGIPLQDSQAIAYLTRHPESPFRDLVEKGLTGEGTDLLQWNVLGSLVRIFRELKGGKLFHEKLDYADKWRRDRLDSSGIVASSPDDVTKFQWWAEADGPWRDVFVRFWGAVRDNLATTEDAGAGNYWGSPRRSNLFNKISLTILAADWFQFLCDRGYTIDTIDDVAPYVEDWLTGVKTTYFSRDWKLGGVKKDATGTKAQWAYLWVQYRKDPVQLPQVSQFRQPRST